MEKIISLCLVFIISLIPTSISVSAYYSTDVDPYFAKFHLCGIVEKIIREPTCTEEGLKMTYCPDPSPLCDVETEYISIPAKGHEFGPGILTFPTCIENGINGDGLQCYNCGLVIKEPTITPATGIHKFRYFDGPYGHYPRKGYVCVGGCGVYAGDIDNNGYISVNDVTKIQKISSGYAEFNQLNLIADVDSSGDLTIRDATYIQLYLAKLIDEFPIIIPEE